MEDDGGVERLEERVVLVVSGVLERVVICVVVSGVLLAGGGFALVVAFGCAALAAGGGGGGGGIFSFVEVNGVVLLLLRNVLEVVALEGEAFLSALFEAGAEVGC